LEAAMLGEKIADIKGKITTMRVLPGQTGNIIESSYQGAGKILGVETRDIGTYTGTLRPDGTLFGTGQGIWMGKGGEAANWTAQGVGVIQKDGSTQWRGSLLVSTQSDPWRKLNTCAALFEYMDDAHGNNSGSLWEWR
jgi:hypothetical protein